MRLPPATKAPARQAFSAQNLRGKRAQRNAARKLCTAKAHCRVHRGFPALDSHDAGAIHPCLVFRRVDCIQSRRGAFTSTHLKRISLMASLDHTRMANAIRGLAMDAVEKAKSGHPGLPMGAADIAT